MFWGCISAQCKLPIIEIRGNLNADRYCNEVLEPSVVPHFDGHALADRPIFMQDGASCHTARVSLSLLRRNEIEILDWPSKSPDQNPIEHIWDWIKREINSPEKNIRTLAELRTEIVTAWNAIQQNDIRRLISSCSRRVNALIAARGDFTRY